jgi:hypothetical protein
MTTLLEASPLPFQTRLQRHLPRLNPHVGAVVWPDKADTLAQGLAFINSAGNAVIKVDNTTNVLYPNKRNSVRKTLHLSFVCIEETDKVDDRLELLRSKLLESGAFSWLILCICHLDVRCLLSFLPFDFIDVNRDFRA